LPNKEVVRDLKTISENETSSCSCRSFFETKAQHYHIFTERKNMAKVREKYDKILPAKPKLLLVIEVWKDVFKLKNMQQQYQGDHERPQCLYSKWTFLLERCNQHMKTRSFEAKLI